MSAEFVLTGVKEIDAKLKAMGAENGTASVKKALRQATRKAMKEVVLPASREAVPVRTGALKKSLTVRKAQFKNPRNKVGHSVIVRPKAFESGKDYYPAFVEYGTPRMEARSYIREPLDRMASAVWRVVHAALRSTIARNWGK